MVEAGKLKKNNEFVDGAEYTDGGILFTEQHI